MDIKGGGNRHSIRLKEYDYSWPGFYFVTICVTDKKCIFGKIVEEENAHDGANIILSELGEIIKKLLLEITMNFRNAELDEWIIMPNHLHMIIVIEEEFSGNVGATLAVVQNITYAKSRADARPAPTLGSIIGSFKSKCINEWLKFIKQNNKNEIAKFWQRNYHEHIIRNEKELEQIRNYIISNPTKWRDDPENPNKTKK